MHVCSIEIENIRCIQKLKWSVPKSRTAGWHVILGDNGSGKSSLLRAVALALVGPREASGLRQSWDDWLRRGTGLGQIRLEITSDPEHDSFAKSGRTPTAGKLPVGIRFTRGDSDGSDRVKLDKDDESADPNRHVWQSERGWFSASYGPFRRFTGSDPHMDKTFYSMPRLARHLSLFEERAALTESLEWLRTLKFRQMERDPEGQLFEGLRKFVNHSEFLPAGVRLEEVTSRDVVFRDAGGIRVGVEQLSDGYRSVLSMTFELIRQLATAFGPDGVFDPTAADVVIPPGVILIDEIDAHLHPTWQRRIGRWLQAHFPNMQFIVSTHSPLICQSADEGSIFLLPQAGSEGAGEMLRGTPLKRLVFGNVLDAYGTEAFGRENVSTRSPQARRMRKQLAALNTKEIQEGLTDAERDEQQKLRQTLPSSAGISLDRVEA